MNAIVIGVVVMMVLAVMRIHVVLSLVIGAFAGGLYAGLPLADITNQAGEVVKVGVMTHFQTGLANGAKVALSYAMLGAFAMAIAHSGLPQQLSKLAINHLKKSDNNTQTVKWGLLLSLFVMGIMSQNVVPIHIAFIPMVVPPLLMIFNRLKLDRRMIACVITFGLTCTYMYLPYGFGEVFLKQILLGNINKAGLDTKDINVMHAMTIPALGMLIGLLIAVFITYRKPRDYQNSPLEQSLSDTAPLPKANQYRCMVAAIAIAATFAIQLMYEEALLLAAMVGFSIFMLLGVVKRNEVETVFDNGIKMMALIGFVMIAAQGFAEVMNATGQIEPLVKNASTLFANNKSIAALVMLLVGLLVTMGIGSSFSTLPIITAIYVPLCTHMGFSPLATVAIIGTAGALGDAGSPASDSTLGPTAGLNADGQHDHIRDSVIPTFLHYNIPLLIAGWIAAMVL